MNIKVNLLCNFNNTGVGRHCENAFFALHRNRPAGMTVEYVNNARESVVQNALQTGNGERDITLFFWRTAHPVVKQFPGRRVIWWFFESDRLPRYWLEQISIYDEVWMPSLWGRDVMLAHGYPAQRIRVVESGVSAGVFRPLEGEYATREDSTSAPFIFLSVGKYENRKSIDEIIAAFLAEFPAPRYPSVHLLLKADYPLFPDRVVSLSRRLAGDPRIRIISGHFSDEQMAAIYRGADAFVFASKAEGFGLPCIEAIACGVPVISTCVSAHATFLERIPGLYIPIESELAPLVDEDYAYFYRAEYQGEDFGQWAIPSIASMRRGMRHAFEDRAGCRARARQAAAVIRREFSWDAIAQRAVSDLQSLAQTARS